MRSRFGMRVAAALLAPLGWVAAPAATAGSSAAEAVLALGSRPDGGLGPTDGGLRLGELDGCSSSGALLQGCAARAPAALAAMLEVRPHGGDSRDDDDDDDAGAHASSDDSERGRRGHSRSRGEDWRDDDDDDDRPKRGRSKHWRHKPRKMNEVPEPDSIASLGIGLAGLAWAGRRRSV